MDIEMPGLNGFDTTKQVINYLIFIYIYLNNIDGRY